jgi:hypothetical protein
MMQEGVKIVVIRFMFILLVFYVELSYAQQNSPQARDQ